MHDWLIIIGAGFIIFHHFQCYSCCIICPCLLYRHTCIYKCRFLSMTVSLPFSYQFIKSLLTIATKWNSGRFDCMWLVFSFTAHICALPLCIKVFSFTAFIFVHYCYSDVHQSYFNLHRDLINLHRDLIKNATLLA